MKYSVDMARVRENHIILNGWAIGDTPETQVCFRVEDEKQNPVEHQYVRTRRDDISVMFFKTVAEKSFGFDIRFPFEPGKKYYFIMEAGGKKVRLKYDDITLMKRMGKKQGKLQKLLSFFSASKMRRILGFLKENGLKVFVRKIIHKLQDLTVGLNYNKWYDKVKPTTEELERQRKETFSQSPRFSIVIPAYKTPETFLTALLDSILAQTYENWEVCIADGSPEGEDVSATVKRYAQKDKRFHYKLLEENKGIAGNTNEALSMAGGDYIVLADHDDALTPDALYECAKMINSHPDCDALYSDEDKMDMDGKTLFDPHFKPDFNPDLLRSVNYICHLFVVKTSLQKKIGGFQKEFDGAQDYDFIFRCVERAEKVCHIPKVLYHWRCHQNSTAENPESKLYAFEAGARAIMAHCQRVGIPAEKVEKGVEYGIYHTTFLLNEKPLVSVIIPNKDHAKDLDVVLKSFQKRSTYPNLEFIVVENNSAEPETFEYYKKTQSDFSNVKVVVWEKGFNFSGINNFGVQHAAGEYLLLLNNDTELITPGLVEELLGYCQREDVGIVGARLLYEDDTIQHAGVIVGFGGIAGHAFVGLHKAENSYFHRAMCAQDYSAVTAACMMTKKSVFQQVGGMDEELAVAFNDVDYCMKVREAGYLVVYNPYAQLYHYESKSRGLEDTPEKVARFHNEIKTFANRWPEILEKGDPYYNPNFTLQTKPFELRDLRNEKVGEPFSLPHIQ